MSEFQGGGQALNGAGTLLFMAIPMRHCDYYHNRARGIETGPIVLAGWDASNDFDEIKRSIYP